MSEDIRKHLEFIQTIITRMNTNSFQIKGWTISIVTLILAIYASTKNYYFVLTGIFPILIFWFLDTYYLTQERKFRGLYNDVAGVSDKPKKIKPFEMRPDLYKYREYSYWKVLRSHTIVNLYLSLIIMLSILFTYLKVTK